MKDYLNCAMNIGEQMLLCGAEVHRAEDSVRRMCAAFGAERTDIFIITSSMVATVYTAEGESYTQTRRIIGSSTDLEKLHHLNALSRKICSKTVSLAEAEAEFSKILALRAYPFSLECLSYAVIAGAFTLFFGGNLREAAVSLIVGCLMRLVVAFADRSIINRIFAKLIAAFSASLLAYGAVKSGVITSVDKVIIGNIMTLIPGIGLTNALRDLFVGDSIAGCLRLVDAALSALAIAAGYFLCAFMMGGGLP